MLDYDEHMTEQEITQAMTEKLDEEVYNLRIVLFLIAENIFYPI